MSQSPRLNFPYIVSSHILDALVQPTVENVLLSTPPASSITGDLYVIGPSPGGVWSGKENCLAQYIGETWAFYVPFEGLTVWNKSTKKQWYYTGTQWSETKAEKHMTQTDNPHSVTAVQVGAETPVGAQAKVNTHINTGIGAHPANAISVTATGNVNSTNVQAALAELDTEKLASTEVVSTAVPNKVLRLNGSAKLPASITGDADTVDGLHASSFIQTTHAANSITGLGTSGIATTIARSDHGHAALTNGNGITTLSYDGSTVKSIAVDYATVAGAALAETASVGTATKIAREDHVHPTAGLMTTGHAANSITGFGVVPGALGAAAAGMATTVSRSDHVHPTTGLMTTSHAANSITGFGTSGTATTIARSDHGHTSISGNASTATKLQTARKINSVNFDGTADITIYAVYAP